MYSCSYFFLIDISQCLWDEVTSNGENLSYMLDETTPVKACGDLAYHVDHDGGVLVPTYFFPFAFFLFSFLVIDSCWLFYLICKSGF